MSSLNKFYIICPLGLEKTAWAEIQHKQELLQIEKIEKLHFEHGGFELEMSKQDLVQLISYLKIPTRVLQRIDEFKARDYPKLFQKLGKIDWKNFLYHSNIEFKVTCRESRLIHSDRVIDTAKDAIEKYFKAYPHKKPVQEKLQNDQQIVFIRAHQDVFQISIDLTGHRLDQRETAKPKGFVAPLRRSIASAMLFTMQQLYPNIEKKLLDPFTGSGTFVNEAINFYSAQELNPQLLAFPFETFESESQSIEKKLFHRYLVSDMTDFAHDNLKTINADNVELKQKNYFEIDSIPENTVIIINPPYNKRIQIDNPSEFYKKIIFKAQSLKAKALTMIYPSEYHSNLLSDKIIYQQEIVNGGLKCLILVWEF